MTAERNNLAGPRRKAEATTTAKPSRRAFDPSEIAKSPVALRRLFANNDIWKAFEAEDRRRVMEDRARRIEEMEAAVRSGEANQKERIHLNVAKAIQQFFVEKEARDRHDAVGPTVGTA